MKTNPQPGSVRRLRIERLDVDLRGMEPHAAEAAARLLRPALVQALAGRRIKAISARQVDVERIALAGAASPHAVASQVARRIADTLGKG